MGPPLKSWREPVAVHRHGIPCCTHMLTQVAEKAPKWTFGKRPQEHIAESAGPQNADPKLTYQRDPVYSFPHAAPRPVSCPPGPNYVPSNSPTTPRYSFGSTPRQSPFPGDAGPGPRSYTVPDTKHGPKFSFGSRREKKKFPVPGPGTYDKRWQETVRSPRWGKDGFAYLQRPRSTTPCSMYYSPRMVGDGPSFSLGARIEHEDDSWRPLGPPYTYFGYNDFGHTTCLCDDQPPEPPRRKKK
jgi:hypothetical protein